MNLEILIGRNRTGKTYHLKELYNNDTSDYKIYWDADKIIDNYLFLNDCNNPFKKIIDFLNNILGIRESAINLSDQKKNNIMNFFNIKVEELEKIKKECIDKNDEFMAFDLIERIFVISKKIENISEINSKKELISLKKVSKDELKNMILSSGTKNYSLLKVFYFIFEIIKHFNIMTICSDFSIYIDEPEKHLHPELISKLADIIYGLYCTKIIIATNSPVFLKRVTLLYKYNKNSNFSFKLKFFKSTNTVNDSENVLEIDNFPNFFNGNFNIQDINIIIDVMFSTFAIFVEGLNDYIFINDLMLLDKEIIDNNFDNETIKTRITAHKCWHVVNRTNYYNIFDCRGIHNVIKYKSFFSENKKFFDHIKMKFIIDNDDNNDKKYSNYLSDNEFIIFYNDIESHFYELEENNKKNDSKTSYRTKFGIKDKKNLDFTCLGILGGSTLNNVDDKIKDIIKKLYS